MNLNFEELYDKCQNCTDCVLSQTRTNVVFGVGNKETDIMFIGEGPGEQEDLQGEPFVGRSGQLLDKLLAEVSLYRDKNIYIANMVKCRPPGNRNPSADEMEACKDKLYNQIKLIAPKIVVCLGKVPACALIKKDFKITVEHGKIFKIKSTYLMATFHPAALLRNVNYTPDCQNDLRKIVAFAKKMKTCPENQEC